LTDGQLAQPDLSIVLCTYNRARLLACALDALARQTLAPSRFEVIVVDNNSTDDTAATVKRHAASHSNVRFVFEPNQGLPIARNTGVAAARGGIIAFTDDDVEVAPEWAAALLDVFERHEDVGYLGGRVLPVWAGTVRPPWVPETHYGPLALQDRGDRQFAVGAHDARACLIGANFAVRRSVFDVAGLFSADFPWGEDREFQLRAWGQGVLGHYAPDVIAFCRVPPERLTKRYQRKWFAHAGRVHARMRLLERMDRSGRLIPAIASVRLFGVPRFLLAQLLRDTLHWAAAMISLDSARAFAAQTRVLYLANYVLQRRRASELPREVPSVVSGLEQAKAPVVGGGSASAIGGQQSTA
jgi:glycosyltransferase involved in cell wall biosynthesis